MKQFCKLICLTVLILISELTHAQDKFKVGLLIPLSGMASEFGSAIKNGASLAIEDNQEKAKGCEFIYQDTQYDSLKAVTAFHRLAGESMDLAYQFFGEDAVSPIAESKKIPLICDSVDPRVSIGRKYVIRNQNSAYEFVEPLPDYISRQGKNKIVIVKTDSPYLNLMVDNFLLASKVKFEKIDVISVQNGETDFKPYLVKLLKGDYDAVGLFMFPGQLSSIGRLFKGREKKYLFFGADFLQSVKEIEASGGVLEGAIFPNNLVSDEYLKRYVDRFHNDYQMKFAGEGYDVMSMIINTFCSRETKPSAEEVIGLIKSVGVRKGVLGDSPYIESEKGDKYFKSPVFNMRASVHGAKVVK